MPPTSSSTPNTISAEPKLRCARLYRITPVCQRCP